MTIKIRAGFYDHTIDLQAKEQSLLACLTDEPCPDCPVRRYLSGR